MPKPVLSDVVKAEDVRGVAPDQHDVVAADQDTMTQVRDDVLALVRGER